MLKDTLMRLDEVLDRPALNFMIHTSPIGEEINDHYHWHIEIIPKLTKVAGFEWGTGFYINPTPPEESARFLREAKIPAVSEKK
jgi:UDPglucose--hexose-1-phosphate uridylyltransferase